MKRGTFSIALSLALLKTIGLLALFFCTQNVSAREIVWGKPHEGVRVGVDWDREFPAPLGRAIIWIGNSTNYAMNLVKPELEQRIEFTLKDASGRPVALTPEGRRFGQRLQTSMSRRLMLRRQIRFPLGDDEMEAAGFFELEKCFKVQTAGEYELEVTVRLLKEDGKRLIPVVFEPVRVKVFLSPGKIDEGSSKLKN